MSFSSWKLDNLFARSAPATKSLSEESRGWLSHFSEVPAWAASLALHVAVLLFLASITRMVTVEPEWPITTAVEDVSPEEFKFDSTVVDVVGNDSNVNVLGPSQAAAQNVSRNPQQELERQLESELLTVEVPNVDAVPLPSEAEFVEQFDATGSTEHPGGVEGAIDRLTLEIAGSLRERKTMVVWLFDESLSLKERRETIAERFENVYRQLGLLHVDTSKGALKTAVASFGKQAHILTEEPVEDVQSLVAAVEKVPMDESGIENVFSAVQTVTARWHKYRTQMRRNMMIIIVTDERGDDYALMDNVIARLTRYGIKVYCVGNAAIFGREKGYVTWTYEDGYQEDLPVDQGPETVAPERVELPFWGGGGQDLSRMSSGFGPYALTRLCAETGGIFLVADENRGPKFDPAVMRNYLPDYRPIREYQDQLTKNLAKRQLVDVAMRSHVESVPTPQLRFRADSDNILRQEITEAQKPAAEFAYKMREIATMLLLGEKDREKLDTPRWRASYDLAVGRALALQVRAFSYNSMLAEMKSSPRPFQKSDSNQWRLVPSNETNAGPEVKKLKTMALEYLTRVVDGHPGTPWALLAARELSHPLSWDWVEGHMTLPEEAARNNDPQNQIQLAEERARREEQRRKAAERAKARPKL